MEIKINSETKKIYSLLKKIYIQNDMSNYFLNEYLTNEYDYIDRNVIDSILKENKSYSTNDAFKKAFFDLLFDDDLEDEKILRPLINDNKLTDFEELDKAKYENNKFYLLLKSIINNDSFNSSNIELNKNYYAPYEGFLYDEIEENKLYKINHLGYFKNRFDYYIIQEKKNNLVWMNLTPFEINTMEKEINKANGNVLTFGLGISYFAYMTSLKDNVKSITIVEKDKEIIKLIDEHIISNFEYKVKIKIIEGDIYSYCNDEFLKNYDYIFIDTYRQASDGLHFYFDLKSKVKKYNHDFWIEKSILSTLKDYLFIYLSSFFDKSFYKEFEFDKFDNQILNYIDGKYSKKHIETESEIYSLFDDKNIIDLF